MSIQSVYEPRVWTDKLVPTRLITSGVQTIAPGQIDSYPGLNARQKRFQFVLSILDAGVHLNLYDASGTGRLIAYAFGERSFTLETSADIKIYNPEAVNVTYVFLEIYPELDTTKA